MSAPVLAERDVVINPKLCLTTRSTKSAAKKAAAKAKRVAAAKAAAAAAAKGTVMSAVASSSASVGAPFSGEVSLIDYNNGNRTCFTSYPSPVLI